MPETREWPRPLRIAAKALLTLIYSWSAVAGFHVALASEHTAAPLWAVVFSGMVGVFGILALVMMLMEFWMAERAAAWLTAGPLWVYAVIDLVRYLFGRPGAVDLGGTALLWVAAAAVTLRIVYLTAFDVNLNRNLHRAAAIRARRGTPE
jgi:hypothetical protein